ncbi:TPA: hypothetical protein U0K67_001228 [Streptococcus suis]|nr:hypothetical protein [Streptococcus suis]
MRMTLNNIMKLVGGISLMTILNGCAYADEGNTQVTDPPASSDTGASRTAEEAAVEAQFEPLFEFLAAEKKDFSNVQTYVSGLSIDTTSSNLTLEDNNLVLKLSDAESQIFSGYFNERLNEQGLKYNDEGVKYDVHFVANEVVFENTTSEKFIHDLYFPIVATTDIKEGIVTSYSTNHPETELETLDYKLDKDLPLFKTMQSYFNIQEPIQSASLSLSNQGRKEFNAVFAISTDIKYYTLGILVVYNN